MSNSNRTPDASAAAQERAGATEDYGGVPISEEELAQVWTTGEGDEPAEENAGRLEQACCPEVPQACPARRAVGGDATCLTGAKHRASDRQGHGRKSASRGKGRAFDEHPRRIGIEMIPPGEEEVRPIDRQPEAMNQGTPRPG